MRKCQYQFLIGIIVLTSIIVSLELVYYFSFKPKIETNQTTTASSRPPVTITTTSTTSTTTTGITSFSSTTSTTPTQTGGNSGGGGGQPSTTTSTTVSTTQPITSTGWLSTRGSDIVDSQGNSVILRGAAWMETVWGYILHEPIGRRLDEMKSYGANVVRLTLNSAIWRGINVSNLTQANYINTVDLIVNNASQRGMYVLLDFHDDLYPNTGAYNCDRIYYDTLGEVGDGFGFDGVYKFWTNVTTRYANNPTVLYSLWGQPQHCNIYFNPGNASRWWNITYNLASLVQSINPNALIFVNGLSADWELPPYMNGDLFYKKPLPLKNIVYNFHRYYTNDIPWYDYAKAYNSSNATLGLQLMKSLYQDLYFKMQDMGYPIFDVEFGGQITTNMWDTQLKNIFDLLKSHNVGFTYWAWWVDRKSVGATFSLLNATVVGIAWENVTLSPTGEIWAQYLKS